MNEWMDDALCAQIGGDAWFPDDGCSIKEARAVCAQCPVAAQCLEFAVTNHIRVGIWGGVSPKKRRVLGKAA